MSERLDDEELEQIASGLDAAIVEAKRKIDSGRVYDADSERIRIDWIRALTEAARARMELSERVGGDD